MTDQRTLKNIINNQREQMQKLQEERDMYQKAYHRYVDKKNKLYKENEDLRAKLAEAKEILEAYSKLHSFAEYIYEIHDPLYVLKRLWGILK